MCLTALCTQKALGHQEAWLQPVALKDSRSALPQKPSLTTTLRLHNCRKRLAEHSWKTSLQYRYITPHSQSKGAKAKLKQKPSLSSPCSSQTQGWLCWRSRRLKSTSYLTDLVLYCAFVHKATTNHLLLTLPQMTFCL